MKPKRGPMTDEIIEVKSLQPIVLAAAQGFGSLFWRRKPPEETSCPFPSTQPARKGIPMANPKCVALNKCEVKDIFDKDLKSAVFKQIKQTVQTLVDKTNGLTFDDKCKDGWSLSATVLSLKVDSTDKP